MDWVDEVMATVDDVDWGSLGHAYGTAELVPLALRAWLSGDDRDATSITPDEEEFTFFDYAGGETVGHAALNWIHVAVFHQGSLYSASAPTCRALVAVFERTPHAIVRLEALQTLFFAASHGPDPADFTDEWRLNDFQPDSFEDRPTLDELNAGAGALRSAIGRSESHDVRDLAVLILIWLSDRAASAKSIIEVLAREPDADLGPAALQAEAQSTELALRVLGLVAGGTDFEEAAERTARRFLDEPDHVGLAASIALARLHRIDEGDANVIARLGDAYADEWERRDRWGSLLTQRIRAKDARDWAEHERLDAEVKALTRNDERESLYLDASISITLHCMPRWRPDLDPIEQAKTLSAHRLAALDGDPDEGASAFEKAWFTTNRQGRKRNVAFVYQHHGIDLPLQY